MRKLFTLIFATILIGCGGEDSSEKLKEIEEIIQDDSSKTDFSYPRYFKNYNLFTNNSMLSFPYLVTDELKLSTIVTTARSIGTQFGLTLKNIDENPQAKRANCEEGEITISSYTYTIGNEIISGEFEMSNFSGVSIQLENNPPICPENYYHGLLAYDFKESSTSSTFGKNNDPFFYNKSSGFDSSYGYLGTLKSDNDLSTFSIDGYFEQFIVNSLTNSDTKSTYKKSDLLIYKDLTLSNKEDSSGKTTINANYKRQWEESGETFELHTVAKNVIVVDRTIISGDVKYDLFVVGKSNRYVKIDIKYGENIRVTFNKEGEESKNF